MSDSRTVTKLTSCPNLSAEFKDKHLTNLSLVNQALVSPIKYVKPTQHKTHATNTSPRVTNQNLYANTETSTLAAANYNANTHPPSQPPLLQPPSPPPPVHKLAIP
ncbi:hypothetical protein E2C01_075957 [Portunus trituberculatus]|uniref:Uncharacterized protein n=1 Tax=Portunus trituberculatus TaxID=210409 RepID=A0A5B7IIG1_PORTR|nr:hypothetical protein [Portunus trituberculatus]